MKYKKLIIITLPLLIIISAYFILTKQPIDTYKFNEDSFSYSQNRGTPEFTMSLKSKNETFDIYSIKYKSRNFLEYETIIYGLLFMPRGKENIPAIVLLPGGGGTKEGQVKLASLITNEGYAVLTIDQRGIGQTSGTYLNFEQDYQIFLQGKEPMQHLSVYDALKASDVLRQIKGIDKNKIAVSGESMGARYAIIAAALDKRLKGVIAISTSGFNIKKDPSEKGNNYMLSVDPDHYIEKISPNYLVMIQGTNDTVVPIQAAINTFSKAKEPKKFYVVESNNHGYCDAMSQDIKESLKLVFEN